LVILLILNAFSWLVVFEESRNKPLEVCFFDVGQGDAAFIETPQRQQILIDGGPSETVLERLEEKMPFWDRTIDLVVLTHPEKDHMFGLLEVLKNYQVENILWTGVKTDSSLFKQWQEAIKRERAKIYIAKNGLKIVASPSRYFEVLYPFQSLENRKVAKTNDSSIVMALNSSGQKVLFTGDISKKIENFLTEKEIDIRTDILKVAHHGSKTSSSEEFLEAVRPDAAVISAGGNNRYGHPAPEVLARLENLGIKVLRTDKDKNICFIQKRKKPFLLLSPTR